VIGLIQRVSAASVTVDGNVVGQIGRGLLVLVGVQRTDGPEEAERLAERLVRYRVFADPNGRMNLSVRDAGGSVLLVPQFTLAADTESGLRPSFSRAAAPDTAKALFERLVAAVQAQGVPHACGQFGAHMEVALVNDGPVTFWLEVSGALQAPKVL
jgi:D-tyrosyl-tRNA(Tyr) deacylase